MMSSFILLALLLITYGPLALARPSGNGEGGQAVDLSLLSDDLVFGLYAELARQRPGENLIFSPLGVSLALLKLSRVCQAHALTSSRVEILAAFGLQNRTEVDGDAERTLGALDSLVTDLVTEGKGEPQLSVQTFLQLNGNRLSLGQHVNQSSGPGEGHTSSKPGQPKSGNTKLLFSKKSTDKLILSNKVQLTGRWRQPFDSRRTLGWRFHPNTTTSVEVAMMYRDDTAEQKMLYDTNCSTTVVQLQYSGRLSALLLLPRGVVRPLEECLSITKMKFWLSNLKAGRAEIRVPKFALRKSYTLEKALKTSGIQGVFSQQSLQLSQALHEVQLVMNESKAEDRGRSDTAIDLSEPHRIIFDRPFMLIVYDEITEAIVLMGKIMDPTVK
ncbi:kallistatin-like [Clupea harengus]|uniref:Kallistatin-like n=1 Tax=Clupea harengus TaxID=7950 RepID=A0A6P3VL39_CLUHA|nr:kallistatin-like [Clupea harengus]